MANIFDNPVFQFFKRPTMDDFLKRCQQRFQRFGLSDADVHDAIKSACDFCNIPMPRMIQDLTNVQNGQTMFVNWDRGSYYDDIFCFNMQQLIDMKVDSKDALTLYSVHEMAQQILYRYKFMHFAANVGCRSWQQT